MAHLPDEIWLEILRYLPRSDLWLSVRHVNSNFQHLTEDISTKELIQRFTIGLNYTLSSGSHHRWYDIRARTIMGFKHVNKHNPQYALFETIAMYPEACKDRALEKWNRIASGFGPEMEWRVGYEGQEHQVKLPSLVSSKGNGVWCDWREMLNGFFESSQGEPRRAFAFSV